MQVTLLEKYQIRFRTKPLHNRVVKDMTSINESFDQFMTDFRNIEEAVALKNAITQVLDDKIDKRIGVSATLLTVEINPDATKIYSDPDYQSTDSPLFSILTADLKLIVDNWIGFLEQPNPAP